MRVNGKEKTMNFNLLYPAIIVFTLLIVGLVMTVLEFKKLEKEEKNENEIRNNTIK